MLVFSGFSSLQACICVSEILEAVKQSLPFLGLFHCLLFLYEHLARLEASSTTSPSRYQLSFGQILLCFLELQSANRFDDVPRVCLVFQCGGKV
jgi:hypothetical protein